MTAVDRLPGNRRFAANRRLVVLVSGSGSNLQAILDACADSSLPAVVAAVFSDQASAYGLTRAAKAGAPAVVFAKEREITRRDYDARLAQAVSTYKPDWIVLAGWMRLLSSAFLDVFPGRVINLHPALPGMFPGTHAIERALEAYRQQAITHTGVMVHLVPDEGVDCGPVLAQEIVPIFSEDNLAALEARVHHTEHRLLVQALIGLLKNEPSR